MTHPTREGRPEVVRRKADVLVVGAGAIGAAVADALTARGRDVVVLERGSGWAAGASWGNAGLVCPSHAGPWATSADIAQGLRWMMRRDSPLGVGPRPSLVPFLGRLLTMSTVEQEASRRLSRGLCLESLALHEKLATEADTGFHRNGLLDTYSTEGAFDRARERAAEQAATGVACRVVDAAEVRRLEPALGDGLVGGVLFPDEAHADPARYVDVAGARAIAGGAMLVTGAEVLSVVPGSPVTVTTTRGTFTGADLVVAAGAWSTPLARTLGVRLPLQAGKGYTVDLTAGDRPLPTRPLMLQEARVAVTPLDGRLRLAGTMQLTGLDTSIDRRRIAGIERAGGSALPAWADAPVQRYWAGLRPCTPDGLPYVGRVAGAPGVVLATGHAMLGLTLAPVTGALVAGLLDGDPDPRLDALSPGRVRRWRWL